ncbi:MAG TPA: replicative DNA helicase, partial [Rhodospirillales bacterium]|nr:replicative DNA helicase [Rhodospirillales bacterium]
MTTTTAPPTIPPNLGTGNAGAPDTPLPPTNDGGSSFRSPPHNLDAEKALLGAICINNRAYERVSEFLKPEHFAAHQHGLVFDACTRLIERGQIADPVTLKRYFEQDQSLSEIGGPAYL